MQLKSVCFVLFHFVVLGSCEMRKSWRKSADILPTSGHLNPFDKEAQNVVSSYPNTVRKNRFRSTYIANKTAVPSTVTAEPTTTSTTEQKVPEVVTEPTAEPPKSEDPEEQLKLMEEFYEEVSNEVGLENKNVKKAKSPSDVQQYSIGILNMTVEEPNNLLKIKLNQTVLRDIFEGRQ
jgi:hypothetical protein